MIDKGDDYRDSDITKISIVSSFISYLDIRGATRIELLGRNVIDQFRLKIGLKKFAKKGNNIRKVMLEDSLASNFRDPEFREGGGSLESHGVKHPTELMSPIIAWGPYQKIMPRETDHQYPRAQVRADWILHKELLSELKEYSEREEDHAQTAIYTREIMICDHQLLKFEGYASWQDRIALGFSSIVSNYGISWTRPLAWLTFANLVYAGSIIYLLGDEICSLQTLKVAVHSFNPLAEPEFSITSSDVQFVQISTLFMFIAQKGVLALMIYEMVRAARRYTRLSDSSGRLK